MLHYVARRLVAAVPTLLGVSVVVFMMVRLLPGDPARIVAGLLAMRTFPRRQALLVAAAGLLGLAAVAVTFDRAAWLGLCAAAAVIALLAAPQARKAVIPREPDRAPTLSPSSRMRCPPIYCLTVRAGWPMPMQGRIRTALNFLSLRLRHRT